MVKESTTIEAARSRCGRRRLKLVISINQCVRDYLQKVHETSAQIEIPALVAVVGWPAGGPWLGQCLPPAVGRLSGGGERRERAGGVRGHPAGYRAPLQSRLLRDHSRQPRSGRVVAAGGHEAPAPRAAHPAG